jgi:ATP-dependent DNA helicase RecG
LGKDDNGKIVGIENPNKLLETLPNLINQKTGILPLIELKHEENKQFIVINIQESIVPISFHGHYYIRSGSVTTELQGAQLNDFLLKRTGLTWDEIVVDDFKADELDIPTIEKFKRLATDRLPFIQNEENHLHILQKLNLMKGGKFKRAAILLFAKNPQKYFLQARIKIGKFLSDSDILTSDIVEGNLFQQVDQALDILRTKYLLSPISYEGIYRREKLEYPYEALREAILNALIHRNYMITSTIQIRLYANQFLIMNDGKLPDEISVEDLRRNHISIPRNFLLAEVFYKSGLIESWGRGTLRIINECIEAGLPEPEFIINNSLFTVCFKPKDLSIKPFDENNVGTNTDIFIDDNKNLVTNRDTNRDTKRDTNKDTNKDINKITPVQDKLLKSIQRNNKITISELSVITEINIRNTKNNISKLKNIGLVKRVGNNKTGHWEVNTDKHR